VSEHALQVEVPSENPRILPMHGPVHRNENPLRCLIVDDYGDAARTLGMIIRCWGHEYRVVGSAAEALSVALLWKPQVVCMDLGLPVVDGFEAGRRIVEFLPGSVTLLAVTGHVGEAYRRRARDAGFNHFLTKPVDLQELHCLLRRVQDERFCLLKADHAQLAELVTEAVGGRVTDLRIVDTGDGVRLFGKTKSFYAKQLAQEALLKILPKPILSNEIAVEACYTPELQDNPRGKVASW
jgi:CheY-like chemotaxis protein